MPYLWKSIKNCKLIATNAYTPPKQPPNLSIKPNYPFSPPQPSITDKSKQNHAYHFHDSCSDFHSCFLSFILQSF